MSFLDDIVSFGKNLFSSDSVGGNLAKSALLGYGLKLINDSIRADNEAPELANTTDYGVREQVDPNTDSPIPVVYGQAYIGGYVTDAVLTNDNQTMWYCLTLCEKTGTLLSTKALVDEDGNRSDSINGQVKVYVYKNGSTNPTNIVGYAQGNTANAYDLFPNWTSNHTMDELVFALIRVDYNATNQVTGLGNVQFRLKNSMKLPGDVLNDYFTNSRYGAGVSSGDINQ